MGTPRRHPVSHAAATVLRLFRGESGAGVLLIAVALAAMIAANSPWAEGYHDLFHGPLGWTPIAKLDTWHLWINDAVMALFFFLVGLEIKREVLDGELASPAQRRLPVLAALAGMVLPAAVFLFVTRGDPDVSAGWAIPAATDIAFAVGVLSLLGSRVPPSLRLFLLTVAIVDDLGAVAIIALAYTAAIDLFWLGIGGAALAALIAFNRMRVTSTWPFIAGALALWFAVLHSGVHATVAGVAAALCVPLRVRGARDSMLLRMEHALAPLSAYLVVPLFGFANAGVHLPSGEGPGFLDTLPLGVALGLFLGKQLGILGAVVAAERLGFAARPAGASLAQLWGVSLLCGIGFTMSLFIAQLAFPASPMLVEEAKLGVIAGSTAAALAGFAVLWLAGGRRLAA
ncbi:sodium/proton antiporter (NhaA family) [Novosphingobium kunmingense]|uniref:Na(+)/H(+) antiporter NhaA n=1 Tax=Novosphingobium kunmingense TaxID=1211806 RepID=A0A2N0HKJ2_9SPHN|nr:Na+/H+ antiporter NhaA [Novosphingobium kunmingense]PKB19470.1 sodium/proton antiporter (NhaA family) [Novosphingobium kunmingense]